MRSRALILEQTRVFFVAETVRQRGGANGAGRHGEPAVWWRVWRLPRAGHAARVHLCKRLTNDVGDPSMGAGGVGAATVASHSRVAPHFPGGDPSWSSRRRRGAIEARRARSFWRRGEQPRELVALAELSYRLRAVVSVSRRRPWLRC